MKEMAVSDEMMSNSTSLPNHEGARDNKGHPSDDEIFVFRNLMLSSLTVVSSSSSIIFDIISPNFSSAM
jgi:hypothetical protein